MFSTSLINGLDGSGIRQPFEWLLAAIQASASGRRIESPPEPRASAEQIVQPPGTELSGKLESWLSRAENDSTPEEFISQFHGLSLPAWDHYTHIRIAYVNLTAYGRQQGGFIFSFLNRDPVDSSGIVRER